MKNQRLNNPSRVALFLVLQILVGPQFLWAAPQEPSNIEQLIIYELNRARNNPARFDQENNLGGLISATAPQPPLAVNNNLVGSASFHAEEMATFNYFAHQSAVTGDWPNKMARDNGYPLPSFYPNTGSTANNIESIAAGTIITTAVSVLTLLIVDAGVDPPGHRIHLLATDPFFQTHREIGTGNAFNNSATFKNYFSIHTAVRDSGGNQFLTGVVYNDANGNRRYDLGEGLGGVTVSNGVTSVQTNAAGGWSIEVSPGASTVTASGGGFVGTASANVTVAASNIEVDFASGNSIGEVNFSRQHRCASLPANFDGDCKSDIGVYRDGAWSIVRSSDAGNTVVGWGGAAQDVPVPANYDGDAKTDIGIYRAGAWSIVRSLDGGNTVVGWGGAPQDILVPADYDGDGKADIAVYRDGAWSIVRSSDGGNTIVGWGGAAQDILVPADYDGDGKVDIAIYRDGAWSILRSSDGGNTIVGWGGAVQDLPVPADYDGDGKADIAIYRGGVWSILRSSDGGNTILAWGGGAQDVPVPADYDGDGKADIAIYRASIGQWIIKRSSDGGTTVVNWGGAAQDIPLN